MFRLVGGMHPQPLNPPLVSSSADGNNSAFEIGNNSDLFDWL